MFGAVILLFASFAWLAIPTLVGRMIDSQPRAARLVRRIAFAAGGTFLFLMLAGLAAGYGWTGAAYSGLVENFGEGWAQTSGLPSLLFGIALLFGTLGLLAQLGLCLSIYRSLTSGRATIQEVLISDDEPRLMSDLAAAAAAMGVPEALVKRSAEARAKATGASVDEILAAWAGGAPAPTALSCSRHQRRQPRRRKTPAPATQTPAASAGSADVTPQNLRPRLQRQPGRSPAAPAPRREPSRSSDAGGRAAGGGRRHGRKLRPAHPLASPLGLYPLDAAARQRNPLLQPRVLIRGPAKGARSTCRRVAPPATPS